MRRIWFALFLFLACFSAACRSEPRSRNGHSASPAMVVSISSDGRFALTSHKDINLIIWDIDQKKKRTISNNANIYSAYFIRGTNFFLWQDLDSVVRVQSIDGEVIKEFRHFPTYGHVFSSDLNTYISCDAGWNLYLSYGEFVKPIKQDGESPSFLGQGKLLNLSVSDSGVQLLSAGRGDTDRDNKPISDHNPLRPDQIFSNFSGAIIWQLPSGRPVFKFPGHEAKTTAILSPDGKYVVSGSENGVGRVWEANTGKEKHQLASIFHGVLNKNGSDDYEKWTYDNTGLIPAPEDLNSNSAVLAFRFVDHEHYLRFLTYSPYAVLYHIDNPLPLKYLPLGRKPFPAVDDYSRNAALDTAPEAGILVMGQQDGGGIIVYQYHPVKQELERIWVGN